MRKYRVFVFEALFGVAVLAVDLLSKTAAFDILENAPGNTVTVAEGIFSITLARNYGASFGIFDGRTELLTAITAIGLAAALFILLFRPHSPKIFRYALLCVIGGGVGNLIDRIAFGYVRDFIDYTFLQTFFGIDFAIGNIADIFVIIGMAMLIVYMIFGYREGDFSGKKRGGKTGACPVTTEEEYPSDSDAVSEDVCGETGSADASGTDKLTDKDAAGRDELSSDGGSDVGSPN